MEQPGGAAQPWASLWNAVGVLFFIPPTGAILFACARKGILGAVEESTKTGTCVE